ncbi:hypothetical protein [Pseudomonas gessardii]|uniref:hypothetical protein n=1 Tax=Pseudomonas gessardii TaxID=78544 RepID=UPI0018D9D798|nr:hypothetical protein [Pseudomonas gessardii]MBH3422886.1 hypothetical protein [Pseudomonas gessardii]
MTRIVTERDFRKPESANADPADYEFREDGAVVRKDRWQTAVHQIRSLVGPKGREFEIGDVITAVEKLTVSWCNADPDDFQEAPEFIDVRLSCGSVLKRLERFGDKYAWTFGTLEFAALDFGADIVQWTESEVLP